MKMIRRREGAVLYLPESFEWLILKSGVVSGNDLDRILENPGDFIESSRFFSWEKFFTDLLISMTEGSYLKYTKHRINENYLSQNISSKIVRQMEQIDL